MHYYAFAYIHMAAQHTVTMCIILSSCTCACAHLHLASDEKWLYLSTQLEIINYVYKHEYPQASILVQQNLMRCTGTSTHVCVNFDYYMCLTLAFGAAGKQMRVAMDENQKL